MHELSIAISLIELAEEEATRRGDVQVSAIHLKLGKLSGVVKEALLFSFKLAREGTALHDTTLLIEEVPIVMHCPQCEGPRTLNSLESLVCPQCGTPASDILQGRELQISALEINELELQT